MKQHRDTPSLGATLILAILFGIGVWAAPDIAAWAKTWQPAPEVHTSAPLHCPPPHVKESRR